jgi:hypothetical protein
MRKQIARIFLFLMAAILLVPGSGSAATWFSCAGDSFCGAGTVNYWGTVDLASGQSSPSGSSTVWRWTYPAGMPGGEGVGNVWLPQPPGGQKEMWVQWYWKYSSGFAYHGVVNKQLYFYPSNTMGMGIIPDIGISMVPQGPRSTGYWPNVTKSYSSYTATGVWHKFKARYVLNSGNQPNGIFQAWADDVLVSNYSNVYYADGSTSLSDVNFVVIYGGVGGSVPKTQYLYVSGVYIGSTDPGGGPLPPPVPAPEPEPAPVPDKVPLSPTDLNID